MNILARKINTELYYFVNKSITCKKNQDIFLPYLTFKSPQHSGSDFSLLKYTKKLEEIQRTATKLKRIVKNKD